MNLEIKEKGGKQILIDKDEVDITKILKIMGIGITIGGVIILNPILTIVRSGFSIFSDNFWHSFVFMEFMIIFMGLGFYYFTDYLGLDNNPLLTYNKNLKKIDFGNKTIQTRKNDELLLEEYPSNSESSSVRWELYLVHNGELFHLFNTSGFDSNRTRIKEVSKSFAEGLRIPFSFDSNIQKSVVINWDNESDNTSQLVLDHTDVLKHDLETEQVIIKVNQDITLKTIPPSKNLSFFKLIVLWGNLYFITASMIAMIGPGFLQVLGIMDPVPILLTIELGLVPLTIIFTLYIVKFFKQNPLTITVCNKSIGFKFHSRWKKDRSFNKENIEEIYKINKRDFYTIRLKGKGIDFEFNIQHNGNFDDFTFYKYFQNAIYTKWFDSQSEF